MPGRSTGCAVERDAAPGRAARRTFVSLLGAGATILGLAACGGSGSKATASASAQPAGRPTRLYTVALSGRGQHPGGAPLGRGFAIVAFHGDRKICWRFAHLHGFFNATTAFIRTGPVTRPGRAVVPLSRGPRLHHRGCTTVAAALGTTIMRRPAGYAVEIRSVRYPAGAVRATL